MRRRPKVGVQAVRQKGGDCLESVRQRVVVTREEEEEDGGGIHVFHDKEENEKARWIDRRHVAEVRGREAERKLVQDQWLEDKLAMAEMERKESVKLMEMLRTARVINKQQIKLDADRVDGGGNNAVEEKLQGTNDVNVKNKEKPKRRTVTREPIANIAKQTNNAQKKIPVLIRSKPRTVQIEDQTEVKKLVNSVKPLDNTEEPSSMSGLSTIMEVTENITATELPHDYNDVSEDDRTIMSPFPQSEMICNRSDNIKTDLESVKKLIDRVKRQGEKVRLSDSHFLNITGKSFQSQSGNKESCSIAEKYQVNHQFIKRVMDFASSSSLTVSSSDDSSSFRPVKAPNSKTDIVSQLKSKSLHSHIFHRSVLSPIPKAKFRNFIKNNAHVQSENTSQSLCQEIAFNNEGGLDSDLQTQLRYYIEKLLRMNHEEISDLSVTTTATSEDVNDGGINESKVLLRQYHLTRQQLQRQFKHSSSS